MGITHIILTTSVTGLSWRTLSPCPGCTSQPIFHSPICSLSACWAPLRHQRPARPAPVLPLASMNHNFKMFYPSVDPLLGRLPFWNWLAEVERMKQGGPTLSVCVTTVSPGLGIGFVLSQC